LRRATLLAALALTLAGASFARVGTQELESVNVGVFTVVPFIIADGSGPHGLLIALVVSLNWPGAKALQCRA
jgi:hypothetical protein